MKGKKLIQLFDTLSKSNKHTILNQCKNSNDKRHKELYKLLIHYNGNKRGFQEKLEAVGKNLTTNNNADADKSIRRFIDFSINFTEDVILYEKLKKDKALRNSLLSTIYKEQGNDNLQRTYLRKLQHLTIENLEDSIQEQYFDDSISLSSRSLKEQDFQFWWELIDKKYELTNKVYSDKLANIYELASSSYLVNKMFGETILDKMMKQKHLKLIKNVTEGSTKSIEIKLAEVRFNFENPTIAFDLIEEVKQDKNKLVLNESENDLLNRKINFLSFLLEFNYNQSVSKMRYYNKHLLGLTKKYNRPDSLNKFYKVLLDIIDSKVNHIDKEISNIKKDFAIHNDEYLLDFLYSFYYLLNKDYKKALRHINELSYAPNLYVRMWSKQIELIIHYKKKNYDLCETLSDRILREMKKNKFMPYTLASSAEWQINIHKKLGLKVPDVYFKLASNFNSFSVIHSALNDALNHQIE